MKDEAGYDNAYDRARLAFVDRLLPRGTGRAADVGCASGVTTALVADAGWSPTGFDLDPAVVDLASATHPGLRFEVGSAGEVRRSGPYDLVVCLEVLEHLPLADHVAFLATLRGAVKPGGQLMLSTPSRHSLVALYERSRWALRGRRGYDWWDPTHVGVASVRQVARALRAAGFVVERRGGFLLVPQRLRPASGTMLPLLRRLAFDVVIVARAA